MDWLSPASALIGAVIGASSTLAAQRGQWGRELLQRDRDTRRQLYGAYLAAHQKSGERLWALANGVSTPPREDYRRAAHEAFASDELHALRSQLLIFGAEDVGRATSEALYKLRQLRDVVATRQVAGSNPYVRAHKAHKEAQEAMREAMRRDLLDTQGKGWQRFAIGDRNSNNAS